jgi:hypothetical protein
MQWKSLFHVVFSLPQAAFRSGYISIGLGMPPSRYGKASERFQRTPRICKIGEVSVLLSQSDVKHPSPDATLMTV